MRAVLDSEGDPSTAGSRAAACAAAGLELSAVWTDGQERPELDRWLSGLVTHLGPRTAWLLHIEAGRDELRYVEQLLGRDDALDRGARSLSAVLSRDDASLLIENGLAGLGISALVLVEDAHADVTLRALRDGDYVRALASAVACVLLQRGTATTVVGTRPDRVPMITPMVDVLPSSVAPTQVTSPPRQHRAISPILALVALVLVSLAGSGASGPRSGAVPDQGSGGAEAAQVRSPAVPDIGLEDVFTTAGVALAPAPARSAGVSADDALSIAFRDGRRRVGPRAQMLTVSSVLANATGPGDSSCLCWVLRMVVVRLPPCPRPDVQERIGYLVDAKSGVITEVVDVQVVGGAAPASCQG